MPSVPTTTVGYERAFSWWAPFVAAGDEAGFTVELLSGQPDAHAYFARMKAHNKSGPAILGELPTPGAYSAKQLTVALERDEVILVDTRHHTDVQAGTVARSLNLPLAKAASYGPWIIDPERETRPIVVLAGDAEEARAFRDRLIRVGVDTVTGYVTSLAGMTLVRPPLVAPGELEDFAHDLLLDVRSKTEYAAGHLPGAVQFSAGRALWALDRLPERGTLVTYCQSGVRNSIIASALRRHGHDVVELDGSYRGWSALAGATPVTELATVG